MALKTIKATIRMRNGLEKDFDPTQMSVGEWAVSTDSKHVWMCFSPGIVLRMATYESFEEDVQKIQAMLAESESILEAVKAFEKLAKQHKDEAAASAAQALAKATEAAQSASSAAGAMSSANASAESALASKQAAEAAKTAASTSETAAAESEASAAGSATAAAASASQAAESASSALTSKEAAAGSAEDAAESAETAKQYSGKPPKPQNGTWWIWDAADGEYKDSGIKSVLSIVKSYPSVAAMEADKANMEEGDLVIIASNTEDVDNSKLYVHNGTDWVYLSDLSGLQGVGIASITKTSGTGLSGSTDVYTITLTDGSTSTFTVYNGLDGTGTGDMTRSVYDTKGKNQDIFGYVDDGLSEKADLRDGKIPEEQIPELGYIPDSQKGDVGGVATLGTDGKVPASQLPSLDYIPVTEKGTAEGVATLDASGKVPEAQLPSMDYEPSGSVSAHNVSPTAHSDMRTSIAGKGDTLEYDPDENELHLKSGDTILSTVDIVGGGGGIKLAAPTDISLTNQDEAVLIKWTDPADIVLNGVAIATWAGTLVVRKVGSAPASKTDGVLVIDSKTRDAYKDTGFVDTGLTNGTQYFYGIFPYTTDKAYTYDATDSITPEAIYPDAPTGVTVQGGDEEAVISFTIPSNATGAKIAYSTQQPSTPDTPYGTILNDVESPYTLSGLTNDTTYYVTVYSTNAKDRDTASETKTVTPAAIYPDAPTDTTVVPGYGSATVSFTLPENATGAKISYSTQNPGVVTGPYGTVISNVVSPYTIAGLSNDTKYYITIFATNSKDRDTAGVLMEVVPRYVTLLGFVIDQNESDPDSMITYIEMNTDFTPAHMDYGNDAFDYGSWADMWFIKNLKPCMLYYDGTVAYELDPNDYTKKKDGTPSDVANANFPGNAMVGIPKVYWKIVDNGDDTANVYICDAKLDDDFHCWSHIDANGDEIDYCYMPLYDGSLVSGKLRSLSGMLPMTTKNRQEEIYYAKSNNVGEDIIWYTNVVCDLFLVQIFLILLARSTDTQTKYGIGNCGTYVDAYNVGHSVSGVLDKKGLFYGKNDMATPVKIFGMENFWGNAEKAYAGWINDNGTPKIKMTYGQSDGSTVDGYNMDGSGYVALPSAAPSGSIGYATRCSFTPFGLIPRLSSGSASTYYCDGFWFDNNKRGYALIGGHSNNKLFSGVFAENLTSEISMAWAGTSTASLSCKPLAPKPHHLFGFTIDQNESDPDSMIIYIEDNRYFAPAHMDYENDVFDYGSWTVENGAWFMDVKPCMLNYDGTVAYYLDPNDYTKKLDGTPSDVANPDFPGNAMVGIPKVYWKIVDNGDDTANVYICDAKLDDDFHCWSHIDANGDEIEYCYIACYDGSLVESRIRSLSGTNPIMNKTPVQDVENAMRNNVDENPIWNTYVYSDICLLRCLLLLISKSTDGQSSFGSGNIKCPPGDIVGATKISGTADKRGMFFGRRDKDIVHKIFGIENCLWGNTWKTLVGLANINGVQKVKMTHGLSDGSTLVGYNFNADGYIQIEGAAPSIIGNAIGGSWPNSYYGYINKAKFSKYGIVPFEAKTGSATTYYCDAIFADNTKITCTYVGSSVADLEMGGIFSESIMHNLSDYSIATGAALSCKPLAQTQTGGNNA